MRENEKPMFGGFNDDLYFKGCLLDMAIHGCFHYENTVGSPVPEGWQESLIGFSSYFLNDLELHVFGKPLFSDPEACKNQEGKERTVDNGSKIS